MDKTQEVRIACTDGFSLAGTLFIPEEVKAAVLLAPATGIKRRFYASFSRFLAQNGYAVLTFENRGIGDSKAANINEGNPSLVSWGKLDMTAALDYLKAEFPASSYHLIGHSAGGQLVGLMENAQDLRSMFNYGCSSGSLQNISFPFIIPSHFLMNFVIPVSNLLFGHTKSQWFGMGEPLPKQVASDWRRWCNGQGYVKVDLDTRIQSHQYDTLSFPSLWLHAVDDSIASLTNVKDMVRVYSAIESEIVSLRPADFQMKEIGHMKFFSSKKQVLWKYALDWLDQQSQSA
ncbi:MAG: alpha/beta fold hydrolase [Bacteroidota bacterium]